MKIGLYFGSFNPVHIGHLIIANHLLNNTNLQQVWLVVSPQNPLKPSVSLLNEYHRLHLARIAVEGEKNLKVSNVEFNLPKPSYTIDTLIYLEEKNREHQFAVIMGSDSLLNIRKWKNYQALLNNYSIYIYKRPGFIIGETNIANLQILDAPLLEISSTQIRNLIKEHKSIRYLVPDIVLDEIEKYGYYR